MVDVLKIIRDMKERLWKEYGDVLARENTQNEKHMTYYLSDLLERHGHRYEVIDGKTVYSETAAQQAFIAGIRIGKREAERIAQEIVADRVGRAQAALAGEEW